MARNLKEMPHLRVRIEPQLLARLERSRQKSGRTLTGEIVHRLEQSYRRQDVAEVISKTAQDTANAVAERLGPHSPSQLAAPKRMRDQLERLLREGKVKDPKQAAMLKGWLAALNESIDTAEDTEDSDVQSSSAASRSM
jgi:hypothetical protein